MTVKRIEHVAQRKAARKLQADTLQVIRHCWADEEADEFNLAESLVREKGVYAYLLMKGLAQQAVEAVATEWGVSPEEALERLRPRRRRSRGRGTSTLPAGDIARH